MKRLLSLIMVVAIVASSAIFCISAEDTSNVVATLESTDALRGEEITLKVVLSAEEYVKYTSGSIALELPEGITIKDTEWLTPSTTPTGKSVFDFDKTNDMGIFALDNTQTAPEVEAQYGDFFSVTLEIADDCEFGEQTVTATVALLDGTESIPVKSVDGVIDVYCDHDGTERKEEYGTDENNHWQICAECEEKIDSTEEAHQYDSDGDTVCNVCGYRRTVTASVTATLESTDALRGEEITLKVTLEADVHVQYTSGSIAFELPEGITIKDTEWLTPSTTPTGLSAFDFDKTNDMGIFALDNTKTAPAAEDQYGDFFSVTLKIADDCEFGEQTVTATVALLDGIAIVPVESVDGVIDVYCDHDGTERKEEYGTDENNHWQICAECEEKIDSTEEAHQYDNDCDTICNVCEYVRTVGSHEVDTSVFEKDGTNHWNVCSECEAEVNKSAHEYDNDCDTTCNVCGYVREITHDYGEAWESNSKKHWHECSVCHDKKDTAAHVYDNGEDNICNVCGYERNINVVAVATLEGAEALPGKEVTLKVTLEPTDSYVKYTSGSISFDFPKGVTVKSWNWLTPATEPKGMSLFSFDTSTNKGIFALDESNTAPDVEDQYGEIFEITLTIGDDCPAGYKDIGFTFSLKDSATELDVTSIEGYICDHSGSETTEYIYNEENHKKECSLCGLVISSSIENHKFDNDCDTACNVCDYERTITHDYGEDWESDENNHWHECSVCHDKKDTAAHQYDNDCDTTCNVCGYVKTVGAHEVDTSVYEKDGTNHWNVCSECEAEVNKSAHEYDNDCDSTCNVCGYVRTVGEHDVDTTAWVSDGTAHWNVCEECGAKLNKQSHQYDNACDTICNVCGYEREITHDYGEDWESDGTNHWHECSVCHDKKDTAAHQYDNACDTICNVCGYVRTVLHDYSEIWSSDETNHWYECFVCHDKKDTAAHQYDNACDTICNVCGYEREITHDYGEDWESDGTNHWHECSVCHDKKDTAAHQYDNACDTICNVCGYVRTVPHDYSEIWNSDETNHWYECSVCHDKKDISAHEYDDEEDNICNVCGYVATIVHDYSEDWSSDENNHWHKCLLCSSKINVSAHKYSSECDTTCDICGYVRTVAEDEHSPSVKWYSDELTHWHVCLVCGSKEQLNNHEYDNNCDTTCNVCGYVRVAPHDYSEVYSYDGEEHWLQCASCTSRISVSAHEYDNVCDSICNVCGYERVAPHGELYDDWAGNADNHWRVCKLCNKKASVENHIFDSACDTVCDVCGQVRASQSSHSSSIKWYSDSENHWHTCLACGEIEQTSAHEYDNACDTTCNVCGYVRVAPHDYSESLSYDGENHWYQCKYCDAKKQIGSHVYDDNCDSICDDCGYERVAPHGLLYAEWAGNAESHWKVCKQCNKKVNVENHVYSNICDTSCNVCGYEREITHDYGDAWESDSENHWHECSVCHEKKDVHPHRYEGSNICIDCGCADITVGDVNGDGELTTEDAVYLLYSVFFPDEWELSEKCDFDGNGVLTAEDAVYLLYATFFPEDYPLNLA